MSAPAHVLDYVRSLTQDPFPNPDYRVCRSVADAIDYLYSIPEHHFSHRPIVACDTESLPNGAPYCTTFSHTPGTGRLIYLPASGKADPAIIGQFRLFLGGEPHLFDPPLVLFHNYLHDGPIYESLDLPIAKFLDTMVMAYVKCLGGGGDSEEGGSRAGRGFLSLKILAWRHCAMRMSSFSDTVFPWALPHLLSWLELGESVLHPDPPAIVCTCGCPRAIHLPRGKTGKVMGRCGQCGCKRYKQGKAAKDEDAKPLSLLHRKVSKLMSEVKDRQGINSGEIIAPDGDPFEDFDPWKRIKQWHDFDRATLTDLCGPTPVPSVAYVPEPELLMYGTRDADATLRLYLHMRTLDPWIFYHR